MYTGICVEKNYLPAGADGNLGWSCYTDDISVCDVSISIEGFTFDEHSDGFHVPTREPLVKHILTISKLKKHVSLSGSETGTCDHFDRHIQVLPTPSGRV